ncbi:MAG: TIGR03842 family LLM class F420-dependent oxidoreductase [Alphaproteobacteria bacterium]
MEFGICFKGSIDPQRTVALCKQAEEAGFTYGWFYDSHVLWRQCFVTMAMAMEHTRNMKFGPCVTNPAVRDWSEAASIFLTLAVQAQNRVLVGLGRGDSSRRVMGHKPATVGRMVEFAEKLKAMVRGDEVTYDDSPNPIQFTWSNGYELPVWIAAYGPKALEAAGTAGDGLIIQLAEPSLCKWFTDQAVAAGKAAGKDMSGYQVMSAAPVWVGDMEKGREQTRWFPAMVGNHVADIVEKYGKDTHLVPDSFTAYIERRKGYDYKKHADKDADHLDFITDDIVEAFSILGPAEAHVEKLQQLEAAGVTQFNIYLMCGEEERQLAEYREHVIPHFR